MIKSIFKLLMISCLLTLPGMALEVPKPVEGTAYISGKDYTISTKDTTFHIKLPAGWGIGEFEIDKENNSGVYLLFPLKGGFGCLIEIDPCESEELAQANVQGLKATFNNTRSLEGGFEADLRTAWYSCRAQGRHVVQIWYSLPKKNQEHAAAWQYLRDCVSVTSKDNVPSDSARSIKEIPQLGWLCAHPSNQVHVLFESYPDYTCRPNREKKNDHYLMFYNSQMIGFLYLKWDQKNLTKEEPYKKHLEEMMQDIKKMFPEQKALDSAKVYARDGYAVMPTSSFLLVTLKADEFLVGFAVGARVANAQIDFEDLIQRIRWGKDY